MVKAVAVRSRWWVPVLGCVLPPLLLLALLLVPEQDRELGDGGILLFALAMAGVLSLVLVGAFLTSGSDHFSADEAGLHLFSRKHGEQSLAWAELQELGWVPSTRYTRGGLAGRRRDGGSYELGGPNIAGWLSQPAGVFRPKGALEELEALCAQHGVAWRQYAPAEVM